LTRVPRVGTIYDYEKTPIIHEVRGLPAKTGDSNMDIYRAISTKGVVIKALRSRKIGDIKTDILQGHLSTSLCHMGNISYRLGAESSDDQIREAIRGDRDSLEDLGRFEEHLAVNGVSLKKTPAVPGPWLRMDSSKERFHGKFARRANSLLTRDYREPFVVPEEV